MRKLIFLFWALPLAACAEAPGEAVDGPAWIETEGLSLSSSGYRASDDPCRLAGETAATANWLGDASDLVACPSGDPSIADLLETYGARELEPVGSYTLYAIPRR